MQFHGRSESGAFLLKMSPTPTLVEKGSVGTKHTFTNTLHQLCVNFFAVAGHQNHYVCSLSCVDHHCLSLPLRASQMYSATIHPNLYFKYSKPRVRTGTTVPLQDYIICAIVAFLDLQLHMLSMKEIIPLYSIPVLVMPSGNKMHRIWSTFLLLMWSIPEVYLKT